MTGFALGSYTHRNVKGPAMLVVSTEGVRVMATAGGEDSSTTTAIAEGEGVFSKIGGTIMPEGVLSKIVGTTMPMVVGEVFTKGARVTIAMVIEVNIVVIIMSLRLIMVLTMALVIWVFRV